MKQNVPPPPLYKIEKSPVVWDSTGNVGPFSYLKIVQFRLDLNYVLFSSCFTPRSV